MEHFPSFPFYFEKGDGVFFALMIILEHPQRLPSSCLVYHLPCSTEDRFTAGLDVPASEEFTASGRQKAEQEWHQVSQSSSATRR